VYDLLQRAIAGCVVVYVIYPLKVVDIDHENGNRPARRAATGGQPRRVRVEVPAVEGTRKLIDERLLQNALVMPFSP
jgi:hypothetical protein